jgi:hypothetical protein
MVFRANQKEAGMFVNTSGSSNSSATVVVPEVQQVVKRLDIELDELGKAVDALGVRLDTVMTGPIQPNNSQPRPEVVAPARCALADILERQVERVAAYREDIDALRSRLQI